MSTSHPGQLYVARTPPDDTERLIAELRQRGYIVYRKPHRRRGNHLAYTGTTGETVRLEQLEIKP